MGCGPSRPTSSVPAVEETRYQITFLLEHEIIGEFGEKIITNPLNSSSNSSDSYKKEIKQNVYIKSIHPSILNHAKTCGMMVGDFVVSSKLITSCSKPSGPSTEIFSIISPTFIPYDCTYFAIDE